MSFKIAQGSMYEGWKGQDWWRWWVWIEGSEQDLNEVAYVEYTLHPTFPNPIKRVDDRSSKFRLDTSGWGEFLLRARLHMKGAAKDIQLSHSIELREPEKDAIPTSDKRKKRLPEDRPNQVILSFSVADADIADEVRQAFLAEGVTVKRPDEDEFVSSVPWEVIFENLLAEADALVAIFGSTRSSWVEREVEAARSKSVPVIPIVIGKDTYVTPALKDIQVMRFEDANEISRGVKRLVAKLRTGKIG